MSMHTKVRIDAACGWVRTLQFDGRALSSRYRVLTCRQRSILRSSDRGTCPNPRVRCLQIPPSNTSPVGVQNVFQLGGSNLIDLPITVSTIFNIASGSAVCGVTPQLISKFGLPAELSQAQTVVSVTNKITQQQTWFNRERIRKPQLFQQPDVLVDPTAAKKHCDFCLWQDYTASDVFGRVESEHTVTASNLFKYCEPSHGLVLFKHHHPLHFSQQQVSELLSTAAEWFRASHALHPEAHHPFFLWNCLPRAGASQFHGHAQVMLSKVALPCHTLAQQAQQQFEAAGIGPGSYDDAVLSAHAALGLVTEVGPLNDRAYCFPSITPLKDMETVVQGTSLASPSFQAAIYAALKTLIDQLGITTFNVGISGIMVPGSPLPTSSTGSAALASAAEKVTARIVSRGKLSSQASDFGGLEVFAGASIGHTDPFVLAAVLQQAMPNLVPCF
ncbi:hypothetical protein ABBQ32_008355 [Trebouxia sp. C0010 RCD-2024]